MRTHHLHRGLAIPAAFYVLAARIGHMGKENIAWLRNWLTIWMSIAELFIHEFMGRRVVRLRFLGRFSLPPLAAG